MGRDTGPCALFFNKPGNWNGGNPNLRPLSNSGGPTQTRVSLPPSKAIDGGSGCPSPDQRGVLRLQLAACDIGALEYVPGELSAWLHLPLVMR
jgi:hypothetical protein